jgi:D-serine deaminase-like pyridoxal phosphate-dependent protein
MRFDELDPSAYDLPAPFSARVLTPALVVHLDRVRSNLARVLQLLGGDAERWRPHVKTTKMREVFAEVARAGVRNFKCATTREALELAATLGSERIERADVLVAYPLLGPALERLGEIAENNPHVRFSVLCEDRDVLRSMPEGLDVFLDVNPGMNRTGIPLERREAILDLAREVGSRFRGLHYYEGHLHDPDRRARERAAFACYDALMELVGVLERAHCAPRELITSGTPGMLPALAYPAFRELASAIHRVSPGTVVFHDLRSEEETPELGLVPAATLLTRVVSHPQPDTATCDAGSKSLAAEAGDPAAYVIGHPEYAALAPSEEHLPLRIARGELPRRGTLLHLVPRHVCPTVNLAEEAILVEDRRVLSIVPVSARAHEVGAIE